MRKTCYRFFLTAVISLVASLLFQACSSPSGNVPVTHVDQIQNFSKIDDKLYRSTQPSQSAFRTLEVFGIQNIVDLRQWHDDAKLLQGSGLKHYRFSLNASKVTYEDLVQIVAVIQNAKGKVLVHCYHGADRTGVVVSAYRIANGWNKERAVDEFINGSYGYHELWFPNLKELLLSLDENRFREDVMKRQKEL